MTEPTKGKLTTWEAVEEFLWAGNAMFTLQSLKRDGQRFTYKVHAKKEDIAAGRDDVTYFVNLLRGPDNTGDFMYLGVARKPAQFNLTTASKVGRKAPSFIALLWFLDKMARRREVLGQQVEFWHTGHCCRCARLLSVPASVASGIGPECARRSA